MQVWDNIDKYSTNACLYVHGDVNSWSRVTYGSYQSWSNTNNDDSIVVDEQLRARRQKRDTELTILRNLNKLRSCFCEIDSNWLVHWCLHFFVVFFLFPKTIALFTKSHMIRLDLIYFNVPLDDFMRNFSGRRAATWTSISRLLINELYAYYWNWEQSVKLHKMVVTLFPIWLLLLSPENKSIYHWHFF